MAFARVAGVFLAPVLGVHDWALGSPAVGFAAAQKGVGVRTCTKSGSACRDQENKPSGVGKLPRLQDRVLPDPHRASQGAWMLGGG